MLLKIESAGNIAAKVARNLKYARAVSLAGLNMRKN
jgi:hypothetical protein